MNSEVTQEIRNAFKIQVGSAEKLPQPVPVVEVGSKLTKNAFIKGVTASNTTTTTIYTCPIDQDVYVTGASLAVIKDATSTSTISTIKVTPEGEASSRSILSIPHITLTAQTGEISITFMHPIKLKRGTIIQLDNDTSVANIKVSAIVNGFIDEASNS